MDSIERNNTNITINNRKRGAFIVLEGLDRSGKSSAVDILSRKKFNGSNDIVTLRFPNRQSTTGKMIDRFLENKQDLNDRVVHLLFVANRWEAKDQIISLLEQGKIVIADRYSFSGIVYSCSKDIPDKIDIDWAIMSESGLPKPDLVIQLDIDAEDASKRGDYGLEKYEKVDFQKRVQHMYNELHSRFADIWKCVAAIGTPEEVQQRVFDCIEQFLEADFLPESKVQLF